jgi:hypothetical protein
MKSYNKINSMFNLKILVVSVSLILIGQIASAQCRTFGRSNCESQLDDYMLNGRMYGGYMVQGQQTELMVVLSAGQKYRIIGCTKPSLGTVWIQLLDVNGRVIFDNTEHDLVQTWDFSVKSTQEFKLKTFVPDAVNKSATRIRDCSLLLLGSKSAS